MGGIWVAYECALAVRIIRDGVEYVNGYPVLWNVVLEDVRSKGAWTLGLRTGHKTCCRVTNGCRPQCSGLRLPPITFIQRPRLL